MTVDPQKTYPLIKNCSGDLKGPEIGTRSHLAYPQQKIYLPWHYFRQGR